SDLEFDWLCVFPQRVILYAVETSRGRTLCAPPCAPFFIFSAQKDCINLWRTFVAHRFHAVPADATPAWGFPWPELLLAFSTRVDIFIKAFAKIVGYLSPTQLATCSSKGRVPCGNLALASVFRFGGPRNMYGT